MSLFYLNWDQLVFLQAYSGCHMGKPQGFYRLHIRNCALWDSVAYWTENHCKYFLYRLLQEVLEFWIQRFACMYCPTRHNQSSKKRLDCRSCSGVSNHFPANNRHLRVQEMEAKRGGQAEGDKFHTESGDDIVPKFSGGILRAGCFTGSSSVQRGINYWHRLIPGDQPANKCSIDEPTDSRAFN